MNEMKIEPFSTQTIIDFYNDCDEEKWALKALVTLLTTADLGDFTDSNVASKESYLWGLQKLFDLCLEKQNKRVEELKSKALNSPEGYLDNARRIYRLLCQGCFKNPVINEQVIEAITALDTVIELFGSEVYPEASTLKKMILTKINGENAGSNSEQLRNGTDG